LIDGREGEIKEKNGKEKKGVAKKRIPKPYKFHSFSFYLK